MWFENPFYGNNRNNVNLLLHGMAKQQAENKTSTTVDVWRGNYSDFNEKPKPRLTIMKTSTRPSSEIATTKTLPPDDPEPTARTLLCHHATDTNGHIKCTYPGRCKEHKLSKPSSFEVSRLNQCRSVIDLYDQKVIPGVVGAQQQISRNKQGNNYEHVEFEPKSRAKTQESCGGTCITHRQANTTPPTKAIKAPNPAIRAVPKQMIMPATSNKQYPATSIKQYPATSNKQYPAEKQSAQTYSQTSNIRTVQKKVQTEMSPKKSAQTYSQTSNIRTVQKKVQTEMSPKKVTFNNEVMVKCINPDCGRTSVTGTQCTPDRQIAIVKDQSPPPPSSQSSQSSPYNDNMPSCYYQHLRGRMTQLKQKEDDDKKLYAPPSSLATSTDRLVKKYNVAKNNCIRRKKFVIPIIDPDALYLPNNVKPRPRSQRPMFTTSRPQSAPVRTTQHNPSLEHSRNTRYVYPRRRSYDSSKQSNMQALEEEIDRRAGIKKSMSLTSIPIGCDAEGPLIYSVSGGKIIKICRMKEMEENLLNDNSTNTAEPKLAINDESGCTKTS